MTAIFTELLHDRWTTGCVLIGSRPLRLRGRSPVPGSPSRGHQHLERVSVVHRAVAVSDLVEVDGAVEDAARVDGAGEYGGQQLLDVGPHGCGAAVEGDVAPEQAGEAGRCFFVLGDTDAADGAARANRADGLVVGVAVADRFEDLVAAEAAGEVADLG